MSNGRAGRTWQRRKPKIVPLSAVNRYSTWLNPIWAQAPEPAEPNTPAPRPLLRPTTQAAQPQRWRRRAVDHGRVAYWAAVVGLWFVIALIGGVVWVGAPLPPIQSLEIPKRPPSIKIVDLQGRLLATRGDMGGAAVSLKDLPRYVPPPFVAIEDRRFYSHHGIDPIGIARAAVANILRRGVSQGGSTLTQQLAKNLFLTQERTLSRKVQELALAIWLERKLDKTHEILDLYLNRVYFGAGAYGIEAAAQRYFSKPATKLTVAEAATLAGLVRSPSRLAPTPQSRRRRETCPARAGRDDGHEVHHRRHRQGRVDAAGACGEGDRAPVRSATSPTGLWTCSTI